jgi:electron transport complex protein RnfB
MSGVRPGGPPAARVEQIDAVLPQTQCTQCGYPGCEPYARAVATGQADINLCVPGGEEAIRDLAALTGRPVKPLDTRRGQPGPLQAAVIDERHCIGCTLCIQACPVDAIVGAAKLMHTVVEPLCTGCGLCLPPCPVDCIVLEAPSPAWSHWTPGRAAAAGTRFRARRERLARSGPPEAGRPSGTLSGAATPLGGPPGSGFQAVIQAAVARVRARRASARNGGS